MSFVNGYGSGLAFTVEKASNFSFVILCKTSINSGSPAPSGTSDFGGPWTRGSSTTPPIGGLNVFNWPGKMYLFISVVSKSGWFFILTLS